MSNVVDLVPVGKCELTMSSLEIAELLESRHNNVKRTMERLENKGLVQLAPLEQVNHRGQSVEIYHVNKRDSFVVAAQLSPEFTARLVDRWLELEKKEATGTLQLPKDPILASIVSTAMTLDTTIGRVAQVEADVAELKLTHTATVVALPEKEKTVVRWPDLGPVPRWAGPRLHNYLMRVLRRRGMTQKELAAHVGMAASTLSTAVRGGRNGQATKKAFRAAKKFLAEDRTQCQQTS